MNMCNIVHVCIIYIHAYLHVYAYACAYWGVQVTMYTYVCAYVYMNYRRRLQNNIRSFVSKILEGSHEFLSIFLYTTLHTLNTFCHHLVSILIVYVLHAQTVDNRIPKNAFKYLNISHTHIHAYMYMYTHVHHTYTHTDAYLYTYIHT